jgi:putative membrane-bound dehydrogenase-like protein
MKRKLGIIVALWLSLLSVFAQADNPLRIFMRVGEKTHRPGQHDHPLFLLEWREMLNQRGAKVTGRMAFPNAQELENSDVLVMYAADAGDMTPEERANLEKFTKRGGGIVIIHDAICGKDPAWFKTVVGGAWEHGKSKFYEGEVAFYYLDTEHPITQGASNFDFDDELYYDLHLMPEARVLAGTYKPDERNTKDGKIHPSVYDIVPQMWVYEKDNYRSFVCIPGHNHKTFSLPHFRAVLLRGIAWAGKRDVNSLCTKEELASLKYPVGGPTAPEKAAAKIQVHPDFNLNLVAAEPLIEKPISMDLDAQGRLWIAETPEYPAGRHGGKGKLTADGLEDRPAKDRIAILEDSNGDGVMDKKSIFFEGLDLVTSLVFYQDGVIVSQAPDIYWLRDTNGDGKADAKETLYTGFGIRDTHAVISNLRWGMDGWVYATVGYSGGHIKSGDGKTDFGAVSSGVIRFLPDGKGMEQVSSKNGNTWGLDIAWDGEVFFSQANGQHCNHVVMYENILARGKLPGTTSFKSIEDHQKVKPIREYNQQAYVQIDHVGGFTAASGATVYGGGAWPAEWDYSYFVTEPTVNLVHRDLLKPTGVTYVASKDREPEFIASTDLWFRPIHTITGPDGALYILDFYNQAVVHNDTRGPKHGPSNAAERPDRDHHFGRIWRVQHKQAKKLDVPNLAKATPEQLIAALEHPNNWVRMTAHRRLAERNDHDVVPALQTIVITAEKPAYARVHALWILHNLQASTYDLLAYAVEDPIEAVQKNTCRIIATSNNLKWDMELHFALIRAFQSSHPRSVLEAIIAESAFKTGKPSQDMLVMLYPNFDNPWQQSAVVGVAAKDSLEYLESLFNMEPKGMEGIIRELANNIIAKNDIGLVAGTMVRLGLGPEKSDPLKKIILDKLGSEMDPKLMVPWSPPLQEFFESLLKSHNPELVAATLPVLVRWDKESKLGQQVQFVVRNFLHFVGDGKVPDEMRASATTSLLGVRQLSPEIVPTIAGIIGSEASQGLQKHVIEALGKISEPTIAVEFLTVYAGLPGELQETVFNQILKRADWTLIMLDVIAAKQFDLANLGPIAINRLRTHPDKKVADRANKVIDEIRGPQIKEKDDLIAKFRDIVSQPGDTTTGRQLFEQNCAVCHKFNGTGKDVAPDLTGMGAHGPGELLVHILDPNRVVEENFVSVSIETKDDQSYDGIVGRENKSTVLLRNAAGDVEINKTDIAKRKSTGRSLMPEGFESLGGEALRNIISYMCANDNKYRMIDLKPTFTASSLRGIYNSPDSVEETLKFKKFGVVKVDDVPFDVVNPGAILSAKNVLVLKGGLGFAKTLPQQVVLTNLNIAASRLHFLGGVAGWGYPWGGEAQKDVPAAKITIDYAYGMAETIILTNGNEIVDYNGNADVPGSKAAPGIVERGQIRSFSKILMTRAPIQKITIESFDNALAPTFVAITAETALPADPKKNTGKRVETIDDLSDFYPSSFGDIRISMFGGGTSHDFDRWFNVCDSTTLAYATDAPVNYTEQLPYFSQGITNAHVLYLCNNQPMTNDVLRKQIFDFADKGGGFLLIHPALWYNWKDWPEYNRVLVGGGTRHHDKYGPVDVTITDRDHPIMHNIPKTFKVTDELYHFQPDPQGTPIKVLAEGKNPETGTTFPVVWIVQHPKARIICITLGHDGGAHDNLAYRVMLQNCMAWAARKL